MRMSEINVLSPMPGYTTCNFSGIRLKDIFFQPALWFRSFYEVLGIAIRVFALIYRTPRDYSVERSPLFSCFDTCVIPFCNFAE